MLTHYVIVRRDLPLGTVAAMIVHAAGESALESAPNVANLSQCSAVVLGARNEAKLLKLHHKLDEANIAHILIHEWDQPYYGQLMSIGLLPCERDIVGKVFKDYQLLRELQHTPVAQ